MRIPKTTEPVSSLSQIPFNLVQMQWKISLPIQSWPPSQQVVQKYIGREPSGRTFNEIVLDYNGQPHNPMVGSLSRLSPKPWPGE